MPSTYSPPAHTYERRLVRFLNWATAGSRARPESGGVPIGTGRNLLQGVERPYAWAIDRPEHSFVSGRTGSGKTTFLQTIKVAHLHAGRPFISIEFHSEAIRDLLSHVRVIEQPDLTLLQAGRDPVVGWNPLKADGPSVSMVVGDLLEVFHHRLWPEAWGVRLAELLRMTLTPLAESHYTLSEVVPFLEMPEFRRSVLSRTSDLEAKRFWVERFPRLTPSYRASLTETVLNKVSVFRQPLVRHVVGQQSGIDFDDLLANGRSLIVDLSAGELRSHRYLMGALLVAGLKAAIYRRPPRSPLFSIFLDEFQEMVVLEDFDDFLRSFRKLGCAVYLATQQLESSKELQSSIFTNCRRFVCFATSAHDAGVFGQEFGGPDGRIAVERMPELRVGTAIVKHRGRPLDLVRVQRVPKGADDIESARRWCTREGTAAREIDAELEERLKPRGEAPQPTHSKAKEATDDEGY